MPATFNIECGILPLISPVPNLGEWFKIVSDFLGALQIMRRVSTESNSLYSLKQAGV